MDIKLTDRVQLKEYFKKNSIPKASDFAEFIDASLNQRDDGIVKLPGDPLSIEAIGEAQAVQKLMNFYRKFSEEAPVWSVNMNAKTGEKVFPGLNVSSGDGNSRLFIEESSGNVGIGTVTPKALAHVAGDVALGTGEPNQRFVLTPRTGNSGDYLQLTCDNESGEWDYSKGLLFKRDGSVEAKGTVRSKGMIFTDERSDHIQVDGALYRYQGQAYLTVDDNLFIRDTDGRIPFQFETNSSQLRVAGDLQLGAFLANQRFIIHSRNGNNGDFLQITADSAGNGNGTWNWSEGITLRRDGKVGIGTVTPTKKLHVERGELMVRSSHDAITPDIASFYANNMTQGIGIGYNRIQALGSNANQDIVLMTRGTGMIKVNERVPIQLVRFNNRGDDLHLNTGYSATEYSAVIAGFAALGGDIYEGGGPVNASLIQVFAYVSNNVWFIRADFRTHIAGENWMVDVMFISNALCSRTGY